jgi:acyl-CoA dehydrogenase
VLDGAVVPESRLLPIAPVSEEQIMNYIAERLLSLPRSY